MDEVPCFVYESRDSYAKVMVMKSPKEMMRENVVSKAEKADDSKKRLYTQIKNGNKEMEFYAQRYKDNMKEFMRQVVFFRTLFENANISDFLSMNYPQMVQNVKNILDHSETEVLS